MNKIIYNNNYQDCFELLLSSLILEKDKFVEDYWFNCNLFIDLENNKIGYSKHRINELWKKYTDIHLETFHITNLNIDSIRELLIKISKEKSIGIFLDLFYLPYCPFHDVIHDTHSIELVEYQACEDSFLIKDHYYKFFGKISMLDLNNAIKSNYSESFKPSAFWLRTSDKKNDFEIKMTSNISFISQKDIFDWIEKDISNLKNIINIKELEKNVKRVFNYLKDISNHQKMVHYYLKYNLSLDDQHNIFIGSNIEKLINLCDKYLLSSERLNSIANILMRTAMNDTRYFSNINLNHLLVESKEINESIKLIYEEMKWSNGKIR